MKNNAPVIAVADQYKIMANTAPVLIWISGVDKLCYFFNEGWLSFTGRTLQQEMGDGWTQGIHPEDIDHCLATYTSSFDQRLNFTMEYRLKRHDGVYRWVTDSGVPRYLENGTFDGYIGTCVDVNELLEKQHIKTEMLNRNALIKEQELNEKLAATNEELSATNEEILAANEELSDAQENLSRMNQQLEELVSNRTRELSISEHRYRSLIDSAPIAIGTVTGKDFLITSANDTLLEFWGRTDAIIGMTLEAALPEIRDQKFLNILTKVFNTGEAFYGNEVKAMLLHSGEMTEFYFNFIYTPLRDSKGQIESITMLAIDVSEQVHARLKVEQARSRIQSMVMNSPIGMTILQGKDLIVEIANQPMFDIWHREQEEVLGRGIWEVFPELKTREFPALIADVFLTGKPYRIPEVLSPHPERAIYIDISYDPLFDKDGIVESVLATVIDITELVNSRKLVEQSEYDLQAINEELLSSNEELSATNDHLEEVRSALEISMTELNAHKNKLSFMLNAIPQQVWTADPTGALAYVNDVVCLDFGYTAEEIVGHGWQKFIHPDDIDICLEKWVTALSTREEYMIEFRLRFTDGNYYWHLGRALPLIEENGVTLWLGTNTNIHVQKQNEEMKDEFLSIASHELKTPLTTIKAYNQLMMRSNQALGLEAFIKKSSDQIYRLEKLITDLLDVTKINAGKMGYNMETFNVREMIAAAVENIQHTAFNHQIIFTDGVDVTYHGDQFRLEQVVHNFLSNAIKYSPDGKKVLVECRVEDNNIIVSIQDFGVGIAKNSLAKLFNRYYRVDNTAMRFDGLGLGLFISSEILKRHQGSFWIESTEGEGSTFYFALPLQITEVQKPIDKEDFYQDQHLTIQYSATTNTLFVDWTGFQNLKTVKRGGMMMVEMLRKFKATKILNNNTNVVGTWSEAADWVGIELFPLMDKAGLRHFAWVYSQSGFSQLSAKKSVDVMLGDVTVQLFTQIGEAEKWLIGK